MPNTPSKVYRLVLEMQTDSDWNDAAPLFVILNIDPAHVIESLSRLEAPCQAFARTLPDRVQDFAFELPFRWQFSTSHSPHLRPPLGHIAQGIEEIFDGRLTTEMLDERDKRGESLEQFTARLLRQRVKRLRPQRALEALKTLLTPG